MYKKNIRHLASSSDMSMEGQPSGGDEPITEALNEGEGDEIVSDEEMFVDVQASLPSDKVAQAWISEAGGGEERSHLWTWIT